MSLWQYGFEKKDKKASSTDQSSDRAVKKPKLEANSTSESELAHENAASCSSSTSGDNKSSDNVEKSAAFIQKKKEVDKRKKIRELKQKRLQIQRRAGRVKLGPFEDMVSDDEAEANRQVNQNISTTTDTEGSYAITKVKVSDYALDQYEDNTYGQQIIQKINRCKLPDGIERLSKLESLVLYRTEPRVGKSVVLKLTEDARKWLSYPVHRHFCRLSNTNDCVGDYHPDCVYEASLTGLSPYLYPALFQWQRVIFRDMKERIRVAYVAQCGGIIVNEEQLMKWITSCCSKISPSLFSFSVSFDPYRFYLSPNSVVLDTDFTQGVEMKKIPIIVPKAFESSARQSLQTLLRNFRYDNSFCFSEKVRKEMVDLHENVCDCEGGVCGENCSCRKLTYKFPPSFDTEFSLTSEELDSRKPKIVLDRLMEKYENGISECNVMCQCRAKCGNTFTNKNLQPLLQLSFIPPKGWGVIARTDIPEGAYVTSYCGHVFMGEELRDNNVVRKYVQDVDFMALQLGIDEIDLACINGEERGNVGRFFNHSCSPNMFPQVVFNRTRDVRFPETAFFANRNIGAGEELTWNYGTHVNLEGVAKQRCYCGEANCAEFLY